MHDPIAKTGAWLNQMLKGYLNYYAVSGNSPSLWWYFNEVRWRWLKSLTRRSQRAFMSWKKFTSSNRPLLPVDQDTASSALSPLRRQNPREEPGALAAHAGICAGGGWQQPSLPRPSSRLDLVYRTTQQRRLIVCGRLAQPDRVVHEASGLHHAYRLYGSPVVARRARAAAPRDWITIRRVRGSKPTNAGGISQSASGCRLCRGPQCSIRLPLGGRKVRTATDHGGRTGGTTGSADRYRRR